MKLIRVQTSACRDYECEYVCASCNEHVSPYMNFCPKCGRKLDKEGKPSKVDHSESTACAIIAQSILSGLFINGIPKGSHSGSSWDFEAHADVNT